MTEQTAQGNWRLMLREKELFSKPRIGVLRSIMLNHWYHTAASCRFTPIAGYPRSGDLWPQRGRKPVLPEGADHRVLSRPESCAPVVPCGGAPE